MLPRKNKPSIPTMFIFPGILFLMVFSSLLIVSMSFDPRVILSNSMEPTLHVGDAVFLEKLGDPVDLKVGANGDIIAIVNYSIFVESGVPLSLYAHLEDNVPIIHRVIEKKVIGEKQYFVTKGDNNPFADGCIKYKMNANNSYSLIEFNASDPVLIPPRFILGKVILSIPYVGLFKLYAGPICAHLIIMIAVMSLAIQKKRRNGKWNQEMSCSFIHH